jgi:large subunit ribosomal protein L2
MATIGSVSNFQYIYRNFRKAGFYRMKGWLPIVRGVAMNPVDHPHGGGQGKTSGGRPSVTPYGIITKGKPTRKRYSPFVIKRK